MTKEYDPREIEPKWQEKWEKEGLYHTPDEKVGSENEYVLVEFAYPSGNLHAGHWYAFSVPDMYARYRRMKGKNVLYPFGFDAFGLPAENAAIKNNLNPRDWTFENIERMRKQLVSMGASFDWSREVITASPEYYKWTQWLFLQFFEKGLAYQSQTPVNWCPQDKTVLANEQVSDGKCDRCGSTVEKRNMVQWNLKITDYAERLSDDLDKLPWPEAIKVSQKNWIGKSEGAEINFNLSLPPPKMEMVFATNNKGKVERMQKLFKAAGLDITLKTPKDIGIEQFDVVEDETTIEENSRKKAQALAKLTDLPVFADDSGFFIDGTELDPVTVKRNALDGIDEKTLTIEQIAQKMHDYYQEYARSRGGRLDAEWRNAFCFVTPSKHVIQSTSVRPVILTDISKGKMDPYLPLRPLYISKATNKHVLEHTEEEELIELAPITETIKKIFTPSIRVFTTRPDTIFGATYLVLAPEHLWITLATDEQHDVLLNKDEVKAYINEVKNKTDIERTSLGKEKTGVEVRGVKAINPATGEEIPIYVADYVLPHYGTGAIMAVPAHDERDYEFAKRYNLPVKEVIEPIFIKTKGDDGVRPDEPFKKRHAAVAIVKHWSEDKYLCLKWKQTDWRGFVIGGIEEGESAADAALREVAEETGYTSLKYVRDCGGIVHAQFYHKVKNENRWAHFHPVYLELTDDARNEMDESEKQIHEVVWVSKDEVSKFLDWVTDMQLIWHRASNPGGYPGREAINESDRVGKEGILINSGDFTGELTSAAKDKMAEKFGEKKTTFKMRDWVVSRQRYWGCPIPVVHCETCGIVAVPTEDLPVILPDIDDYLPSDTGESPLAKSEDWLKVKCHKCGGEGSRETDTLDTFVDSSWYFLRYTDPRNDKEFASSDKLKTWMPIDFYSGGAEHTTMHLLYSRFFHKVLYDLGLVFEDEPYKMRMNRGLILGPDGQKMSKSKGNVVDPDDYVKRLGADTVRTYLAFIGPYNEVGSYPWSPDSIVGVRRFFERVWRLQDKLGSGEVEEIFLHNSIKGVTESIENIKMNTAVPVLMTFLNTAEKSGITRDQYEILLRLLAPFAPHISEELWESLGHKTSIHAESWPLYDESKLMSNSITLAIQVDGKVRGDITIERGLDEGKIRENALNNPQIQKWLEGKKVHKILVIPEKIVSIVTD